MNDRDDVHADNTHLHANTYQNACVYSCVYVCMSTYQYTVARMHRYILLFLSLSNPPPTHPPTGPGDNSCQNNFNGLAYRLADSVRAYFLDNPDRASVHFRFGGKPLLLWWLGMHHDDEHGGAWEGGRCMGWVHW